MFFGPKTKRVPAYTTYTVAFIRDFNYNKVTHGRSITSALSR